MNTIDPDSFGTSHHHEYLDPNLLEPANIYVAQMAKKQKVFQPSSQALAFPPPKSSAVFQLLPIDDGFVQSGTPDTSYGFRDNMMLSLNSRIAYMKFDLSGLTLATNVSKAILKVFMENVGSTLGMQAFGVSDDSWSEQSLTWNTKPVIDTVALNNATYYVAPEDLPGWIEIDVTSYFNAEYIQDQVISLSIALGGDLHTNTNGKIFTKEGYNPSHLVIHVNGDTVPPPSQPQGIQILSTASGIALGWVGNEDFDLASYSVYRSADGGAFERQAMGLTASQWTDYRAFSPTNYTYMVKAVDIAGSESEGSAIVSPIPDATTVAPPITTTVSSTTTSTSTPPPPTTVAPPSTTTTATATVSSTTTSTSTTTPTETVSTTASLPQNGFTAFADLAELKTAVDAYLLDNSPGTAVAQTYGHPIGVWNTSQVTSFNSLFRFATEFSEDISGWDTSRVTDFSYCFQGATSFNSPLDAWDVGSATLMTRMFEESGYNLPLSSWGKGQKD